jgi:IclR family KDG regulon transcriptional repressor
MVTTLTFRVHYLRSHLDEVVSEWASIPWQGTKVARQRDNPMGASMERRESIQSVERALDILSCLSSYAEGLSLGELGRLVGLPKSTTHRLLSTLVTRGYVKQDVSSGKYSLGLDILRLANTVLRSMEIRRQSQDLMEQIVDATGETCSLHVREGDDRVAVRVADGKQDLRSFTSLGSRVPLHCGAPGKAILAYLPEATVARVLAIPLEPRTQYTVTDRLTSWMS